MACHPALLIADEPTGNLDAENSDNVMDLLTEVAAAGTTVIVATHDLAAIRGRGGRLLRLERGEILATRTLRQRRHRLSTIAS